MTIKKVIGIKGINYFTHPKMGSSNTMFGVTKNLKGLNPNGRKKEKRKSRKK